MKPGYTVGHRYTNDAAGAEVIIGTYETPSTTRLANGTTAVIPDDVLAANHVALILDAAFENATYDQDRHLSYPDGRPVLGPAQHERVEAYRRRHDHTLQDAHGYVLCRCPCPRCVSADGRCICPKCANHAQGAP